jgi:hypothetical protein
VAKKKKEEKKEKSIPERIKIGYQDVAIERETSTFSKQTDSYGEYDHRKNSITIQTQLSDLDEADTLLHEILHCRYPLFPQEYHKIEPPQEERGF